MLSTQSSQPPSACHSSDLRVSPNSHSSRTRTENPADHIISLSGYYTVSSRQKTQQTTSSGYYTVSSRRKTQQTTSSVCQVTTLCRHDRKPSRPHHQVTTLCHHDRKPSRPHHQVTTLCRHDGKPSRPHHQSVRLLHCVVTTKTRRSANPVVALRLSGRVLRIAVYALGLILITGRRKITVHRLNENRQLHFKCLESYKL